MCCRTFLLSMAAVADIAAQDALPARTAGERPDAEPKLFLNDLGDALPPPETAELGGSSTDADVEHARDEYDRAQRKQQRWQRLFKSGVLAQIEVESAVLQAARARVKYERARATQQQRAVEALRARVAAGQITADALASAESALETARAMAVEAESALRTTELLQAETNVERQRRLAAAGAGAKGMVERAKAKFQQLKANSD